jgi:hypothetical protein
MPQKKKPGWYKPLREMNFFELSVISVMPHDIYREIKDRMTLVETYLDDGAPNTAKDILDKFLH